MTEKHQANISINKDSIKCLKFQTGAHVSQRQCNNIVHEIQALVFKETFLEM